MTWIWIFLAIAIALMLVALGLGLTRAASMHYMDPEQDEIDEAMAEQMTRPNGNVEVLGKDES